MDTNPYNPLQPVTNPAFFFGRERAFAFFRQHLVDLPRQQAMVLIGRRGLGKSALVWQLQYQLEDRIRPCIVSLGMVEPLNEDTLMDALVQAIRRTLDEMEASTLRLPPWPPEPEPEAGPEALLPERRAWFRESYLDVAFAALRQHSLLLILDDAHLLMAAIDRGDLADDWWAYLGELMAAHERLDLIVTVDATAEDRVLGIPLLADPALQLRLDELAPADAERLIREPMAATCRYEHGVVELIGDMAGGHPFMLHSVCRLLYRRSEERNHNGLITAHDLTAILPALVEQVADVLGPLWETLSANERLTLRAVRVLGEGDPRRAVPFEAIFYTLTRAGYSVNKTQVAAALRALDYNGLLHSENDTYRLSARLIAAWLDASPADLPARVPAEETARRNLTQIIPIVGVLLVLIAVGVLGAALLSGALESNQERQPGAGAATATLSLNIEATHRADFATQTEAARPTRTPTATDTATTTPSPTITPSSTVTPTATPTATASATSTATATLSPTATLPAIVTPVTTPTPTPPATATPRPSRTPTPTPPPTLDPGG